MKLVKTTHYQGYDPYDTSDFILCEGTKDEVQRVATRWATYTLPVFEGLQLIAEGIDPQTQSCFKTFANGLSKNSYWVRLTITE